jgi:hypothetical protein
LFEAAIQSVETLIDLIKTLFNVIPKVAQASVVDQDPDRNRDHVQNSRQEDREDQRVVHWL